MTNQAITNRLAAIGKEEAQVMRKLARLQAERCRLLCDGYTANAETLGLDPATDPTVIEPKDIEP